MEIKVLGSGCCAGSARNIASLVERIEQVARARNVSVTLTRVEELREIAAYGVMSTPAVVIGGKVVHAGGVPAPETIEQWLTR